MKKEEERRRERREEDQNGAGAWLLGATTMHSEKEPDVEGDRRQGSRQHIQGFKGLGVRVPLQQRTPGSMGVCGDPGGSSSVAVLTPTWRQASEMGVRLGRAEPVAFVSSPQLLSLSGYNLSRTPEFKQLLKLGLKQSWGRMINSVLVALPRPPEPCWGTSLPSPPLCLSPEESHALAEKGTS